MSTPYQPIYDCTLLFCRRMYRMHMPPLLGSFAPRTRRRGSTSQLKCLYVEESKKERKAVSEEACGRSAHSYIKYTKFGKCLHVSMRVHLSFLFASCPASCLACMRSSLNEPSPSGWLPNAVASCVYLHDHFSLP